MTIHVTETQKFIVQAAIAASGADERLNDPVLIDDMIRAMLVIQQGGLQAYMLNGFNWSCISRNRREPLAVTQDRDELGHYVEYFNEYIDHSRSEPARRIRGNRAKRVKALFLEAQHLQEYAGQRLRELEQRRWGARNHFGANWDYEPNLLNAGHPDEDAA